MHSDGGTYRAVHDTFWTDIMILDLQPDEKLFYIWLFTNPHLDTCGCYQISLKTIEYETALSRERIVELIQLFVDNGRIKYDESNKEIILLKWKKNNSGFFKPSNSNCLKAIKLGASKIKTPEFREIVDGWLGAVVPAELEAPQAPTPPPSEAPDIAPTQGGRTQPEPEPEPKPEPKPENSSNAREQLCVVATEHDERLKRLFPDINLPVAIEKMLNHYRDKPVLLDPYDTAIRWLQNEFPSRGQQCNSRASPSGPVSFEKAKSNRTKQAVQEFVERRKRAECQETASSSGPSSTDSPRPLGWSAPPSG